MRIPPGGNQYQIVFKDQCAVVTEVGATLRVYRVGGRDVISPFPEDGVPKASQGKHLLPWPNRIRDGRYQFGGESFQLPINEHPRNNAIHGLLSWVPWQLEEITSSMVRLGARLFPSPGWPGSLLCQLTHRLGAKGLSVEIRVTNVGQSPSPLGYAAHPYFTFDAPIDQLRVKVPFGRRLEVDERLLPVSLQEHPSNHLAGQPLGDILLDTAFCDPVRTIEGNWEIELTHQDRTTIVWADQTMKWVQIYTPPHRTSIAIEPMTCGPDAFNPGPTHDDLLVLEPGQSFTGCWGVQTS